MERTRRIGGMTWILITIGALVIAAVTRSASAVNYTAQSAGVSVEVVDESGATLTASDASSAIGPVSLSVHQETVGGPFAQASADSLLQVTEVSDSAVAATSRADASDGAQTRGADAASDLLVEFTLATATPYRFAGFIEAVANGEGVSSNARTVLAGPGGDVFADEIDAFIQCCPFMNTSGRNDFDVVGILPPGNYTLSATLNVDAGAQFDGFGEYDVRLDFIPEPATLTLFGLAATAALRRRRGHRS